MLPVPGLAAVPGAVQLDAGVEGGDVVGVADHAVGILVEVPGPVVAGLKGLLAFQEAVELGIEITGDGVVLAGAAFVRGHQVVGPVETLAPVEVGIEVPGVGGAEAAELPPDAPVEHVGLAADRRGLVGHMAPVDPARGVLIPDLVVREDGPGAQEGQDQGQAQDQG